MKNITLLASFLVLISSMGHSQSLNKDKEVVVTAGLAFTDIKNKNIKNDTYKVTDNKNGYTTGICFNKYFKKRFGFGVGIGVSNYKQLAYQKGLFQSGYKVDQDGYGYNEWISSNMTYTQSLIYVDVPVTLHLLVGKSDAFYGFLDIGIVNDFLASGKYTEDGTIETMNKYPTSTTNPNPYFTLVTQNNPYYNVGKKSYSTFDTKYYKKYNLSGRVAFGFVAAMSDKVSLKVEPFVNIGLTDITSKDNTGKDYVNVMGETTSYAKTKTFSYGLSIGFGINLK